MRVKIKLHGELKRIAKKDTYEVEADTPAEAIRGVSFQIPNLFRRDGKRFICKVKECVTKEKLFSNLVDDEINLIPLYCCAGGGRTAGIVTMVVGIVVVALAVIFTGGAGLAGLASLSAWATAASASSWFAVGALMAVGGLLSALTPTPSLKSNSEESVEASKTFGATQNTTTIGTRIPIGYGKYKVYGQLLSYNTQAVDK